MKIDAEALKSALKLIPEHSQLDLRVEPNGSAVYLKFTDKGGRDVKITIFETGISSFPTITYTEQLPR